MNVAYPFILDVAGYPAQIINFFVVTVRLPTLYLTPFSSPTTFSQGLFWMRWKRPDIPRPFKGRWILCQERLALIYVYLSLAAPGCVLPRCNCVP